MRSGSRAACAAPRRHRASPDRSVSAARWLHTRCSLTVAAAQARSVRAARTRAATHASAAACTWRAALPRHRAQARARARCRSRGAAARTGAASTSATAAAARCHQRSRARRRARAARRVRTDLGTRAEAPCAVQALPPRACGAERRRVVGVSRSGCSVRSRWRAVAVAAAG